MVNETFDIYPLMELTDVHNNKSTDTKQFYEVFLRDRKNIFINGTSLDELIKRKSLNHPRKDFIEEDLAEQQNNPGQQGESSYVLNMVDQIIKSTFGLPPEKYSAFQQTFHQQGPGWTEATAVKQCLSESSDQTSSNPLHQLYFTVSQITENEEINVRSIYSEEDVNKQTLFTLTTKNKLTYAPTGTLSNRGYTLKSLSPLTAKIETSNTALLGRLTGRGSEEAHTIREICDKLHEKFIEYQTHLVSKKTDDPNSELASQKREIIRNLLALTERGQYPANPILLKRIEDTIQESSATLSKRNTNSNAFISWLKDLFSTVTGKKMVVDPAQKIITGYKSSVSSLRSPNTQTSNPEVESEKPAEQKSPRH